MGDLDVGESIDALGKMTRLLDGGCHGCLGSSGVGGFGSHARVGGERIEIKMSLSHGKSVLMSGPDLDVRTD